MGASLTTSNLLNAQTENDYDVLVAIVISIEHGCITNEFKYYRKIFKENMGRLPSQAEEPYVLQQ
jgi:hypothetical protein